MGNVFCQIALTNKIDAMALALAFTVSTSWSEFYAACRMHRAMTGYSTAIGAYVDGECFYNYSDFSGADFETLKEQAWEYRDLTSLAA